MLKGLGEALAGNLVIIWVMFILCPVYLFLGTLIANLYKNLWLITTNRQSYIYQTVGDISWLFPFTTIRLTDTVLIAVLCGILSLLIVVSMVYNNMQEKNQKRLEKEIKEEMDKKKK